MVAFEAFFGFTRTTFRDNPVNHRQLQEVKMITEKLKLQQEIRERFGDWQIEARQQSLCQRCLSFYYQHCEHSLLPVTSEGSDCPYYHERKRDNTVAGELE
jgi:hypothetical protein